jgi:glycosyltransferase involved in cell wall biosynthesis
LTRKIRVLELRSVRGTGGGPEKTILLGAKHADADRFAVTVCYIRDSRDHIFGIDKRAGTLDIDYLEVIERHSFDPSVWGKLSDLVRQRHIDIVHGHDYKTNLLALLLARRLGVSPMATSHGWTGQTLRERLVYYPGDKRVVARMPRAIAVSTDIKNELVRCGARADRVTVLLNGIDADVFRRHSLHQARVRYDLGLGDEHVVIGAVGRLERQKRFDLLLEAFGHVLKAQPTLRLVIVGDGSLRTALEGHATSLGVRHACVFTGHRDDIANVHHAFDVFVQSSEYEGTPNAVLEAMAMETPIVATDVGGTSELVLPDVHALVVPSRDASRLRDAMERVVVDRDTARSRARAARNRVETELSFQKRTRRLEQIYEELMSRWPMSPSPLSQSASMPARVPRA